MRITGLFREIFPKLPNLVNYVCLINFSVSASPGSRAAARSAAGHPGQHNRYNRHALGGRVKLSFR
jgi:hypothetical protein